MENIFPDFQFEQAGDTTSFSPQQLKDISDLIYQTDPYIYPALFLSQENAEQLIPELIKTNDPMFCKENLFVAKEHDEIIAIILWHKGPLVWTEEQLLKSCETCGIQSLLYIDQVRDQYFKSYQETPEDVISVINVCVKQERYHCGIGKKTLSAFLNAHQKDASEFELFVLADNPWAIHLYEDKGFKTTETLQGFNLDGNELPCYRMKKCNSLAVK